MTEADKKMISDIFDSESMGYAYVYPIGGDIRQEYLISLSPENIANFIGNHGFDAEKIIITDVADRLVVNTSMVFLHTCPNQELCQEIIGYLAPIQLGETEAGSVLAVGRDTADEYFAEEDRFVAMAELGMQ